MAHTLETYRLLVIPVGLAHAGNLIGGITAPQKYQAIMSAHYQPIKFGTGFDPNGRPMQIAEYEDAMTMQLGQIVESIMESTELRRQADTESTELRRQANILRGQLIAAGIHPQV